MGFGFNLFYAFILVPSTAIFLLTWLISGKFIIGKTLGLIWLGIFGLVTFSLTIQALRAKKTLKKKDYYGQYIIDRDFFRGKQANWQYNHFRFEIKENDTIHFHITNNEKILKTYLGKISTTSPHGSEILVINMIQPIHHITTSNPTIYRSAWSFYLVFYSPMFNNVYFKKGKWK